MHACTLFEMKNEEPVCGGWWRRLCGCGRGGHHVVSGEEGDFVGVEGEGPLRRVTMEEMNAWVWKGRGLCGE